MSRTLLIQGCVLIRAMFICIVVASHLFGVLPLLRRMGFRVGVIGPQTHRYVASPTYTLIVCSAEYIYRVGLVTRLRDITFPSDLISQFVLWALINYFLPTCPYIIYIMFVFITDMCE